MGVSRAANSKAELQIKSSY